MLVAARKRVVLTVGFCLAVSTLSLVARLDRISFRHRSGEQRAVHLVRG
jgi:hypothetical protein